MSQKPDLEALKKLAKDDFDGFAEIIEQVLPEFVELRWTEDVPYKRWFQRWQAAGITILPNHYYSPVPDLNVLSDDSVNRRSPLLGLDMADEEQVDLLKKLSTYKSEYGEFATRKEHRNDGKYFLGGAYPRIDAELTYAMVRHRKPRHIIEIGSGFSTLAMSEAVVANVAEGFPCEFTTVDPYPSGVIACGPPGLSESITQQAEDLPSDFFDQLGPGDILFIDSTHVIKPGNDVDFEYFSIIPRLNRGVAVHVHDIFLPNPYPSHWVRREHIFWNEQYLLIAFLAFNNAFRTTLAIAYLCDKYPDEVHAAVPALEHLGGGSFWFERVG